MLRMTSPSSSADFNTPEAIGRTAAERTVRRLSRRSLPTGNYPVLLDATVAGGLIRPFGQRPLRRRALSAKQLFN